MTRTPAMHRKICLALCGWAALSAACSESEPTTDAAAPPNAGAVAMEGSANDAGAAAKVVRGEGGRAGAGRSAPSSRAGASASSATETARGGVGGSSTGAAQADRDGSSSAGRGDASSAGGDASGASGASSSVGGAGASGGQSSAGAGGMPADGPGQAVAGQGGVTPQAGVGGEPASGAGGMGAVTASMRRIAFLGDSITETSCTSQLVFGALRAEGHTNFDLVGTKQNQQSCGVDNPDRDVEGHSGYLVTEIVGSGPKAAELPMWCAADRADVVLMHFGTNDAWNGGVPIIDIVSAFSQVLAALRAVQPQVILLVAQIIPLSPDNCPDCEGRVTELNGMIPMWAASESTPESPVYVVDQWTGFDPSSDAYDRIHPNMQGSQKMADVWLAALRAHNIF